MPSMIVTVPTNVHKIFTELRLVCPFALYTFFKQYRFHDTQQPRLMLTSSSHHHPEPLHFPFLLDFTRQDPKQKCAVIALFTSPILFFTTFDQCYMRPHITAANTRGSLIYPSCPSQPTWQKSYWTTTVFALAKPSTHVYFHHVSLA